MKNRGVRLIGILLVCVSTAPLATAQWGGSESSVGVTLGYIGSDYFGGGEAMLTWMNYGWGCVGYVGHALSGGVEYFPGGNQHAEIWGQKVTGRVMFNCIYLGFSQQTFFLEGTKDFRVMPEIGLDAITWAEVGYGYSWHLTGSKIRDVSPHRLSVHINLRRNYQEFDGRPILMESEDVKDE